MRLALRLAALLVDIRVPRGSEVIDRRRDQAPFRTSKEVVVHATGQAAPKEYPVGIWDKGADSLCIP